MFEASVLRIIFRLKREGGSNMRLKKLHNKSFMVVISVG
jgi:hypothetical protein